jgi:hypothetical protein
MCFTNYTIGFPLLVFWLSDSLKLSKNKTSIMMLGGFKNPHLVICSNVTIEWVQSESGVKMTKWGILHRISILRCCTFVIIL